MATTTTTLVDDLKEAFGSAEDVTPAEGQPLHILLPSLALPEPWKPSPSRALTIWERWPEERPRFLIDMAVVGDAGEPPRSNDTVYVLGEAWRHFSFSFPWNGDDPVIVVQSWLERFSVERN